jgi:sugar lactone lactonase YvrE
MPFETGIFDGMTIDAERKLWVAVWDGACILQVDPESGTILDRIDLPVSRTACCAFAGADLDQLVITSAAYQRQEEPLAGNTFVAPVSSTGLAAHRFQMKL